MTVKKSQQRPDACIRPAAKAFFGPETTETGRESVHASPIRRPYKKNAHVYQASTDARSVWHTWRAFEIIGKDLFHDQAVEAIRQRATMITSTHSRIHRQPPLYKAKNASDKIIRACICIVTTVGGHVGWPSINLHPCPRNNSDRTWKPTLRGSTRSSEDRAENHPNTPAQRWFNKCCKATAGPVPPRMTVLRQMWLVLRIKRRRIHLVRGGSRARTSGPYPETFQKNNRTSQIVENAGVDKPIRP
ncbi:hypothetical protein V8E54_006820 [Elaphomyces granulatus]